MLIANLRLPAFRKPSLSAKQGLTSFVLLAILALNLFAGVALFSGLGGTEGQADARVTAGLAAAVRTKPAPEPLKFRPDVAPQDAVAINAAVPVVQGPIPPPALSSCRQEWHRRQPRDRLPDLRNLL
jgi:hypothetical protein